MNALLLLAALMLDRLLGEPRRFHPLVGFGRLAVAVERRLNRARAGYLRGLTGWAVLVLPPVALTAWLATTPAAPAVALLVLYLALGGRSLAEHAEAVVAVLRVGNLDAARRRVGYLVSRDTAALDEAGVARAAVESVLENGNDAVFGAIFWFVVAGAPGAVLYRLANTLDAMWGYRNERYARFGWAAARLDDVLNFIPARLTASSYALVGQTRSALRCWRQQAADWESPNAGPVMAAGAGALHVKLGGAAIYHGQLEQRPALGCGHEAGTADIARAVRLVRHTLYLWLAAIASGALLLAGWQHA